jgi:hypothetical protein
MDSTGCTAKQELHMATKYDEADSDGLDDLNLLTEAALAKKIRMTPGAVRNARMRGSLGIPFIKLGRGKRARIRYPPSAVNKALDERTFFNTREAQGAEAEEGLSPC